MFYQNIETLNNINQIIKFHSVGSLFKNSYLYTSVYCDNFEVFTMLINHPKFIEETSQ